MRSSILPLFLGAFALLACGDVVQENPRSATEGAGATGAASGTGAGGAASSSGTAGAGGDASSSGTAGAPPCDFLSPTTASSVSRWHLDLAQYQAVYPRRAELVETGLDGAASTLLLMLAKAPDQSTVLLASRFDGRKAPSGSESAPLSAIAIALPGSGKANVLTAVRGTTGKVRVLLTGSLGENAQWFELDAVSAAISAIHDLGGPGRQIFLAASPSETLAGLQPLPMPSLLSLASEKHSSFATAPTLGCSGEYRLASGAATGDGFLVAFTTSACAEPSEAGLYVGRFHDGAPVGTPQRLDLGVELGEPSLVRNGDRISLMAAGSGGPYRKVYAVSLALDGSVLDAPVALGSTIDSPRSARVGTHSVAALYSNVDHTLTLVADDGKTLGTRGLGDAQHTGFPMDIEAIGEDTLLAAWSFEGTSAPDSPVHLLHVEQLRCAASAE